LCISVCPTKAIEFIPEEKKVKIFISRCCFCAQCVDICPPGVLSMTGEFLLANYDKYADELVVVDSGKLQGSVKKEKPATGAAELLLQRRNFSYPSFQNSLSQFLHAFTHRF
jgi:formate hydrogenlyase subunit 6/NADH:ubiquinone oxidoreductase subunit I